MVVNHSLLLVSERKETQWSRTLRQALLPLGKLRVVSEEDAEQMVVRSDYDVIIIDAGVVYGVVPLISRLRAQRPEARVIVATASPTWRRAREALQAGAADYIRKSLDEEELCSKIEAVLKLPPPQLR